MEIWQGLNITIAIILYFISLPWILRNEDPIHQALTWALSFIIPLIIFFLIFWFDENMTSTFYGPMLYICSHMLMFANVIILGFAIFKNPMWHKAVVTLKFFIVIIIYIFLFILTVHK